MNSERRDASPTRRFLGGDAKRLESGRMGYRGARVHEQNMGRAVSSIPGGDSREREWLSLEGMKDVGKQINKKLPPTSCTSAKKQGKSKVLLKESS